MVRCRDLSQTLPAKVFTAAVQAEVSFFKALLGCLPAHTSLTNDILLVIMLEISFRIR